MQENNVRQDDVQMKKINRNKNSQEEFMCQEGNMKHGPKNCKANGKKCAKCGKMNHFASDGGGRHPCTIYAGPRR